MSTLDLETINDFLKNKEYAHAYMDEFLNTFIATQIKVLREKKQWTQEQLGEAAGMHQERIAVLENVNHSSWKIGTLQQLAKAFDVTLHVSFENFSTELRKLEKFTSEAIGSLERVSRQDDLNDLLSKQQDSVSQDTANLLLKTLAVSTLTGAMDIEREIATGNELRLTPAPRRKGSRFYRRSAVVHTGGVYV